MEYNELKGCLPQKENTANRDETHLNIPQIVFPPCPPFTELINILKLVYIFHIHGFFFYYIRSYL